MLHRIRHLKNTLKSREATADSEVWLSLRQQRGRRLRAQAQLKELQLATARGQLISFSQWQHDLCATLLIVNRTHVYFAQNRARIGSRTSTRCDGPLTREFETSNEVLMMLRTGSLTVTTISAWRPRRGLRFLQLVIVWAGGVHPTKTDLFRLPQAD